jgi:catechol 2,3-dioxygenase-like lactoylglutathione lyase family enzyme
MPNAKLGPAIPVLDVHHVEEALRYYVDRLGFQVDFRYEKDPGSYAGVKRDDVHLHMHYQSPEQFEHGTAGHHRCRIPVDNPDELLAEYRARGVLDKEVSVHETEWGTREFGFRDPDGNALVFFKILEGSD